MKQLLSGIMAMALIAVATTAWAQAPYRARGASDNIANQLNAQELNKVETSPAPSAMPYGAPAYGSSPAPGPGYAAPPPMAGPPMYGPPGYAPPPPPYGYTPPPPYGYGYAIGQGGGPTWIDWRWWLLKPWIAPTVI